MSSREQQFTQLLDADMKPIPNSLTTALIGDSGAHNLCLLSPHDCRVVERELEIGGISGTGVYGIGGQFYGTRHKCYKADLEVEYAGIFLYGWHPERRTFSRIKFLIDGNHPGCLELRTKCGAAGEFDGQSTMVFHRNMWLLYTRSNGSPKGGCRGLQVCAGHSLSSFEPFDQVNFNGLPAHANIYFAHVYVMPGRQQVMAMMPLECNDHCPPGIYIGFSGDGRNFHTMYLVSESLPTHHLRTSNVPVHGLEWGDKGFYFYEHEFVRDRMHPDRSHLAETYIKTKWCSFNWETQDVVWERYWSVAQNVYWFSHRITEQNFFEDELEWTVHDSSTGRRHWHNALTGAWFWSDGYLPKNVWLSSWIALDGFKIVH